VRVCKFEPVLEYEQKEVKAASDGPLKIIQFATKVRLGDFRCSRRPMWAHRCRRCCCCCAQFALETLARAGENDVLPK
jgi:hypothetical protein